MEIPEETLRIIGFAPRRQYNDDITEPRNMNGQFVMVSNGADQVTPTLHTLHMEPNGTPVDKAPVIKDIDNAFTLESGGITMKTPVSILQELLSRRGITPSYELVQIEGAIHEPTFRYRVSYNDKDAPLTAMGAGRSKKEAKHSAARALIDKISAGLQLDAQANMAATNTNPTIGPPEPNASGSSGDGADKIIGNPIGWLQEMCMSRRWPPPTYETETEVGLPHERLFTIACSILNYREVGKGKSKKIAKRLAAHKMWNRLQQNPIDNTQMNDLIHSDLDGDALKWILYYGPLKTPYRPSIDAVMNERVAAFHYALKANRGVSVRQLRIIDLTSPYIDSLQLLYDVATEIKFHVNFIELQEKTLRNEYQCMVHIHAMPTGFIHGYGNTAEEARRRASVNTLAYLKMIAES